MTPGMFLDSVSLCVFKYAMGVMVRLYQFTIIISSTPQSTIIVPGI